MKRYLLAATLAATLPLAAGAATPGDVASLIKTMPHLSAGAFSLGMTRDQAMATLKAHGLFDGRGAEPSIGFHFRQLPNQDFLAASYGLTAQGAPHYEEVGLAYTMFPSPAVVTGLSRTIGYTVATAPNVTNTIAALRAKYGHENDTHGSVLTWLLDASGRPLPAAEVRQVKQADCMFFAAGAFIAAAEWGFDPIHRFIEKESLGNKIAKGYVTTYGDGFLNVPSRAICLRVIYLHATFTARQPNNQAGFGDQDNPQGARDWPAIGNHLVSGLVVYIYDAPLDYAASVASRAAVLGSGAKHAQQQEDAAKNNKPGDL